MLKLLSANTAKYIGIVSRKFERFTTAWPEILGYGTGTNFETKEITGNEFGKQPTNILIVLWCLYFEFGVSINI